MENPDDIEGILAKAKQYLNLNSNYLYRGGQEHANEGKGGAPKTELKITLYSNGFQIDDGPLREYNIPENQQFMKELNKGYVPKEIQNKYKGGVSVGLSDKRAEEFRPPTPPRYVAYSGSGQSMG